MLIAFRYTSGFYALRFDPDAFTLVKVLHNLQIEAYYAVGIGQWWYYLGERVGGGVAVSRSLGDGLVGDSEMVMVEDVGVTLNVASGYSVNSATVPSEADVSTILSSSTSISVFSIGTEVLSSAGNFISDIVIPETTSTFYIQENKLNVIEYEYICSIGGVTDISYSITSTLSWVSLSSDGTQLMAQTPSYSLGSNTYTVSIQSSYLSEIIEQAIQLVIYA